jgi:hypothetical protein
MSQPPRSPDPHEEVDWIDSNPLARRVASNLERSFRPSCLISLIITALIVVILRRYFKLPIAAMAVLTAIVWWAVLVVLVRLSGPNIEED